MSKQYLHFTLGPVQGFVAQARRTRDFWAGSFLLSWLTARAMYAVQNEGGKIVMPFVEGDELLARIGEQVGIGPLVGSLPNNFVAEVAGNFSGDVAVQAVEKAWKHLADKVWENDDLAKAGINSELWNQQIKCFWDMTWVISDSDDGRVLSQRKNWRSYMPPESLGDKCTMMGEWQELSGADRPHPKQQKSFWNNIAQNKGLDLREGERLCAIAYVKRRFVHVWDQLDGHQGWELPTSVPSTSYLAALHWLENLIEAKPEAAVVDRFCKIATCGERLTRIYSISNALGNDPPSHLKNLADVDGRALFDTEIEQDSDLKSARKAMLSSVSGFDALLSPFYAILMMDGDSLGKTKQAMGDATSLSAALGSFTREVPHLVKQNNGFLIYAGGDDVLAILPLEDALPCAATIRKAYMQIFKNEGVGDGKYSISAAIEYAHMKLPLTMILKDVHKLLDDVAKDATGRDAVACRIWKPGGLQQTWAMPWNEALEGEAMKIMQLADKLGKQDRKTPGYAGKFLYNIYQTLDMLDGGAGLDKDTVQDMLVADYVGSGLLESVPDKLQTATGLIERLLNQCRVYKNRRDTGRFAADAAFLMRFLAQKGVGQ